MAEPHEINTVSYWWDDLAIVCKRWNAVIYSDNDGNVWVCVANEHFRMTMITKDGPMEPFEKVIFERVKQDDK